MNVLRQALEKLFGPSLPPPRRQPSFGEVPLVGWPRGFVDEVRGRYWNGTFWVEHPCVRRQKMVKRNEKVAAASRLLSAEVEYLTAAGWTPGTREYEVPRSTVEVTFSKHGYVLSQEKALVQQKRADDWPNVKPDEPKVAGELEPADWLKLGFMDRGFVKHTTGDQRNQQYKHSDHPIEVTIHHDTKSTEIMYRRNGAAWCMIFDSAAPVPFVKQTLKMIEDYCRDNPPRREAVPLEGPT